MRIKYLMVLTLFVSIVSYAVVNNQTQPSAASTKTQEIIQEQAKINLNTADLIALQQIKGIGRKRAKAIITYREEHGKFTSIDQINKVPGINPGLARKLQEQLTVA